MSTTTRTRPKAARKAAKPRSEKPKRNLEFVPVTGTGRIQTTITVLFAPFAWRSGFILEIARRQPIIQEAVNCQATYPSRVAAIAGGATALLEVLHTNQRVATTEDRAAINGACRAVRKFRTRYEAAARKAIHEGHQGHEEEPKEVPTNGEGPILARTRYVADKNRVVYVERGLGKRPFYGTFSARPTGSPRRYKSPALPMRAKRNDAQADLDAYATAHGWQQVNLLDGDGKPVLDPICGKCGWPADKKMHDRKIPAENLSVDHVSVSKSAGTAIAVVEPNPPLTRHAERTLRECEGKIRDAQRTAFLDIGRALRTIRDDVFPEKPLFRQYCRDRWDYDYSYACKLIVAVDVFEKIQGRKGMENLAWMLSSESQVREIAGIQDVDQQIEVLKAVEKAAPLDVTGRPKVTAELIRTTRQEIIHEEREGHEEGKARREEKGPDVAVARDPVANWRLVKQRIKHAVMSEAGEMTRRELAGLLREIAQELDG